MQDDEKGSDRKFVEYPWGTAFLAAWLLCLMCMVVFKDHEILLAFFGIFMVVCQFAAPLALGIEKKRTGLGVVLAFLGILGFIILLFFVKERKVYMWPGDSGLSRKLKSCKDSDAVVNKSTSDNMALSEADSNNRSNVKVLQAEENEEVFSGHKEPMSSSKDIDVQLNLKNCPHCCTAGVLPMPGNICPNCKKPL